MDCIPGGCERFDGRAPTPSILALAIALSRRVVAFTLKLCLSISLYLSLSPSLSFSISFVMSLIRLTDTLALQISHNPNISYI